MNKIHYFSVKDKHANLFYPPFPARNEDEAKKIISDSVDVGSLVAKYPVDFILCYVGTFDFIQGFVFVEGIDFICSMTDIIRPEIIERTRVIANLVDKEEKVSE